MQKSAIINFLGSNTHNSSAIQHSNHIDKTFFLVIMIELSTMSKNFKKSQSLITTTISIYFANYADRLGSIFRKKILDRQCKIPKR